MEITPKPRQEEKSPQHEEYLESQNTCCLCGTTLNFYHQIDYATLKVREDADCPSCGIQMRSKDHVLQ